MTFLDVLGVIAVSALLLCVFMQERLIKNLDLKLEAARKAFSGVSSCASCGMCRDAARAMIKKLDK